MKQNIQTILPAGVPSSQAFPGFLISALPSVCVPDVIGVRAAWIRKKRGKKRRLSVCLFIWVGVVCVFFLLSVEKINSDFNRYLCHGALDVRITLLQCLFLFLICIIIILIPACVYLNMYTYFLPLPYSYTFAAIFICMLCVMFYIYTHFFVLFLLSSKLDTCVTVPIDVIIPLLIS